MSCLSSENEAKLELYQFFSSFGDTFLSVPCCLSELSIFSSATKGEVNAGEQPVATGELLSVSARTDSSPLFNSNEGDTFSLSKCVGQ